jgi:hypothetical protein
MSQPATALLAVAPSGLLPLTVDFHGGRLTSDGGWCWVAKADAVLKGCHPLLPARGSVRRNAVTQPSMDGGVAFGISSPGLFFHTNNQERMRPIQASRKNGSDTQGFFYL